MTRLSAAMIVLALSLSGCAGLATLTSVVTPKDLYEVTPKSTYDSDLPTVTSQIVVEEPTAAGGLNTDRIAVKPNPYLVQYFPESSWVDRAPLLVQTLLIESFENTGKVGSVGRQAIGLTSDYTVLTDLREFQAQSGAEASDPLTVVVQINMKLVREPQGVIVASSSFGSEVEVESNEILDVVGAFDRALGRVMRDAVDWAVREIASIEET
jgi:cholesterol transport system auxiliary component